MQEARDGLRLKVTDDDGNDLPIVEIKYKLPAANVRKSILVLPDTYW